MILGNAVCRSIITAFAFVLLGDLHSAFAADPNLIEAAKREGQVTWYTALTVDITRVAAEAFQKQYGIPVNSVRGDDATNTLRLFNEHRAGHALADVTDGTTIITPLKKQNMLMKWLPDDVSRLPKEAFDPAGYWVAMDEFFSTPAFNTNVVPRGTEPKTYQDLLDPKWKGKMAWASHRSTSGGSGFVGTVLTTMGENAGTSYLHSLAAQKVIDLDTSARALVDQVIAGEYPIALQVLNHQAAISAAQGAPVDWIPLSPAMGIFSVAALLQDAPHPNAGKLFEDFMTSEQGQLIFQNAGYIPVDPNVPPKPASLRPSGGGTFQATFFSPEQVSASLDHWYEVYKLLFD
jgi:iron(III) transport system substrate-binding protein